ncbi:hypothetical protein [Sphingobium sp. Sx8-8]|uniref:hypothetical protein n=1 Tax=Sphingobium sp. Sx8-8 TaxID=2933617 RepID=UPI001F580871|nr:hypothetical protein [Sphingobium sp. Sx8-8]
MGGPLTLLWAGAACAGGAMALLRLSWGRPKRSVALNGAAWALLLAGLALGAAGAGAWGVAVVTLVALTGAFLCLGHAGMMARPGKAAASNRRVHMLPQGREPLRLGGRLLTFALTVPGAMAVALIVSLAVRAASEGMGEANGNVLTLFLMPVLWALLATLLLLWPQRRRQMTLLLLPALGAGALWGMLS